MNKIVLLALVAILTGCSTRVRVVMMDGYKIAATTKTCKCGEVVPGDSVIVWQDNYYIWHIAAKGNPLPVRKYPPGYLKGLVIWDTLRYVLPRTR